MKYRMVDLLQCPDCGGAPLDLKAFEKVDAGAVQAQGPGCRFFCSFEKERGRKECSECYRHEITEGILVCTECGLAHPIVAGVPRFVPDWAEDFPWFPEKHAHHLPGHDRRTGLPAGRIKDFKARHASTKASFGFQWLKYEVSDREEDIQDFFSKTGVTQEELNGKLILDAGCGMGRFLMVSGSGGNEVVGLDLSRAVERAYGLTRELPFVHVVQGDLMNPPLRKGAFDLVYSIGVLHHTPSTKKAFRAISGLVRRGGKISVWVYQKWVNPHQDKALVRLFQRTQELVFDGLRKVTTRLPHEWLHCLCHAAVPLGWLQMRIRSRRWLSLLFWPLLIVYVRGHERWQIRLLDTFDWYSPAYQWKHTFEEVFAWYREDGFVRVQKTPSHPIGVTGERA